MPQRYASATWLDRAERLDEGDPLAPFLARFHPPDVVYFDGNSLGPQPLSATDHLDAEMRRWRERLIGGWSDGWFALSEELGDLIAPLVGAAAGTIRVADSTSVCLYKAAHAALELRPGRSDVITDPENFPTDRYVLDAAARSRGGTLRMTGPDLDALDTQMDDRVGLVSFSHVDYRTAAINDIGAITALAHDRGAGVVWDLSHSAGAVPVGLDGHGVDFAVGCTYKYLNGGPGSPAFIYVDPDLVGETASPIPGWLGHAQPFAMSADYDPAPGPDRFLSGTPPILSLAGLRAGLETVGEAGIDAIRTKSVGLTDLAIEFAAAELADLGIEVATPLEGEQRGGHVALRHPDAWRMTQMLIAEYSVVPDFRGPDLVRVGLSPLSTRYRDVVEGLARLVAGVTAGHHESYSGVREGVT